MINLADNKIKQTNVTCSVMFGEKSDAEAFAKSWTRESLMGCSTGCKNGNHYVEVYNVAPKLKKWIDDYIIDFKLLKELGL